MKYHSIESFVKGFADNGHEESLWEMVEEYKTWKRDGAIGDCLLRSNARAFCSNMGIPAYLQTDYMEKIAHGIYEYFALRYKELGVGSR